MNGASRFFQFLDAYPNGFVGCGYWTIALRMHGNLDISGTNCCD
jgi:hypothetical protein